MKKTRTFVAVTLLSALALVGALPGTGASFTAEKELPGNTVTTATLERPQLHADPVTSGSATLNWTTGPTGGATPTYTLTRSTTDNTDTTTIYTGINTTFTDPGNLPTITHTIKATALAAGYRFSLALDKDGTVWAWGNNTDGQLGDGTTTTRTTPVQVTVPAGVTITHIAAGRIHSLALDKKGNVWAWGYNRDGQLGNGTNSTSKVPVRVAFPGNAKITTIAAGDFHSLAIDNADNTVWAWGANGYGQLGNDTYDNSNTPVHVIDGTTNLTATAIAAGAFHSLATDEESHAVLAWGNTRNTPAHVTDRSGANVTATAIAAGWTPSRAIDEKSHAVLAWGIGGYDVPVHVTDNNGANLTATAIAAGDSHSLAIDEKSHAVLAWGNNNSGQLGNNTYIDSNVPVSATITGRAACPTGSGPIPGTATCSLAANTTYTYTVTTHIGHWTTTSEPTTVTTNPTP